MLLSIAVILFFGYIAGEICKKLGLPALLGMLAVGVAAGPYVLNLIDESVLNISSQIRKIALIIILMRAGFTLNWNDLKKSGRSAIFMCFVPACFEIAGMILLAPKFLGLSTIEAALAGAVVAAVSPAVIVPKMIGLIENKKGTDKSIPQMILAGASVDDVFVIVMFTSFMSLAQGGSVSAMNFVSIPLSVISGIFVGIAAGYIFVRLFARFHVRDTVKILFFMSAGLALAAIEDGTALPFSGLIAVMFIGIAMNMKNEKTAARISIKLNKIWIAAEIFLFVLVGASVDISYVQKAGAAAILLILCVLIFRMAGVFACMLKTNLTIKERLFCMIAYCPKATVQAAIGGVPLAAGLECGNTVLTVAVMSIIITAPLGAYLIDLTSKRWL